MSNTTDRQTGDVEIQIGVSKHCSMHRNGTKHAHSGPETDEKIIVKYDYSKLLAEKCGFWMNRHIQSYIRDHADEECVDIDKCLDGSVDMTRKTVSMACKACKNKLEITYDPEESYETEFECPSCEHRNLYWGDELHYAYRHQHTCKCEECTCMRNQTKKYQRTKFINVGMAARDFDVFVKAFRSEWDAIPRKNNNDSTKYTVNVDGVDYTFVMYPEMHISHCEAADYLANIRSVPKKHEVMAIMHAFVLRKRNTVYLIDDRKTVTSISELIDIENSEED